MLETREQVWLEANCCLIQFGEPRPAYFAAAGFQPEEWKIRAREIGTQERNSYDP
jgi:hypothetical protein